MAQRAGELCHRVMIQHKTTTYDEYNYETEAWTEFKKLWGKLNFLSVKDSINAKAAGSETTARLKLRKRKDIDTGMRVLFDGQTFQIVSPPKPDNENGRIYMTLELSLVE
ncbi:phage head closure protein [Acinetobacter pseudolwoffii]|uniref:phage head closure protein n=1 Tax=Acinetobacter pseudolwoffii TaxID=2053287 RepID=UPI002468490D|nr:phage head closure protein [Acinetobacter pseudolwoffii]MDH5819504.1 phage head closure protein [Acinetobacter pseudolwoffii]